MDGTRCYAGEERDYRIGVSGIRAASPIARRGAAKSWVFEERPFIAQGEVLEGIRDRPTERNMNYSAPCRAGTASKAWLRKRLVEKSLDRRKREDASFHAITR